MEENKNKPFYIIPIILGCVALFGVGILIGTQIQKNTECAVKGTVIEGGKVVPELCEALMPPENEEIFAYSGKVLSVGDNQFKLNTEVIENYELVTKEITVQINDNTKIVEIDPTIPPPMPKEVKEGEEPEIDTGEIKISFDKIKEGNQVNVSSSENIKGQVNFTAEKVTLINEEELPEPPETIKE